MIKNGYSILLMLSILEKRNIKFKKKFFLFKETIKSVETIDFDMQFISALYEQQLKNVINDIELALNNEYEKIDDPWINNKYDEFALITPNCIEYYDEKNQKYDITCSLEDFRELTTLWKNFLGV